MNTQHTNYLLFLFGNYRGGEKFINSIMGEFSPIISNDYLKFIWGDYGAVVHFQSDVPFEDLSEFVSLQLGGMVEQYFLVEKTDKTSAFGDEKSLTHLLDLETPIEDSGKRILDNIRNRDEEMEKLAEFFMSSFKDEILDNEFDEEDDDDNEINMIKLRSSKENNLTLDQLLDKITEKGIKSLSKKEKQQLEKYANGK